MSDCSCKGSYDPASVLEKEKVESVIVLGSGFKNCQKFHQNVIDALTEMKLELEPEYVRDMQ
ncbi:MAG: thioredoxin family protein [Treponemataceae bacterium]|nr:thioredoxin family protein [Treponemataceae bacterium]